MALKARIRFERRLRGSTVIVVVLLCTALIGCTALKEAARSVADSSRSVTGAFSSGGTDLKNKVVVVGIDARQQSGFAPFFVDSVTGRMQKDCRGVVVAAPGETRLTSPPKLPSGEKDGFALALLGRQQGVNQFVFGTLNDLRFQEEKKGFWWWKDNRYALRAVIRLEIIDTASGAKALDDSFWEEMELDELRYQQIKDGGPVPLTEIAPILDKLMRKAAARICATVRDQPWQGYVIGAEGSRITLSSGAAVGLTGGRTVEVFAKGQAIETKDGRRYLGPGEKIGEATISMAADDRAEATLKETGRIDQADTVRLKR